MPLFRRREKTRPYDEATAYARCHGDRDEGAVRIVKLPPRRKRYDEVLKTGEDLRRQLERRLDDRDAEQAP